MDALSSACLEPAQTCACHTLRSLSRRATRWYESHLAEWDLTAGQFTLLIILHIKGPISLTTVAEMVGSDRTTLYRSIKPLQDRGYLTSKPNPEDARARLHTLSAKGRRVLEHALPRWREAQSGFVRAVGEERWGLLFPDLARLSTAVDDLLATLD